MPVDSPHLSPVTLLSSERPGRSVLDHHREADVRECRVVGHGKTALAEVLGRIQAVAGVSGDDHVLLPALITDGVVGAVEAAGFEPRFYRVRPDLGADPEDLRAQAGEGTAAVLAVHYFGFEQPGIDALRAVADEREAALLVDAAHSPLSRSGSRPLAATGDAGFASLHKQLPVPDGAVLTVSDPALAEETARAVADGADFTAAAGTSTSPTFDASDAAFCVESVTRFLRARASRLRAVSDRFRDSAASTRADGGLRRSPGDVEGTADGETADSRPSPAAIHRSAADEPSKLTLRVLDRVDPGRVVDARRRNYRYWLDSLQGPATPEVLYPDLPPGVCPQVFPVLVGDPDSFCRSLPGRSTPSGTWPPLPDRVADEEAFPVANHLANRLVRLPVHQGLYRPDLAPTVAAVQNYRTRPPSGGY